MSDTQALESVSLLPSDNCTSTDTTTTMDASEPEKELIYVFFDTETTGKIDQRDAGIETKNNFPHIIQIAYLVSNETPKVFYMKTERESHPGALEKHKITKDILETQGEDAMVVMRRFCKDIAKADVLVAHNLAFDLPIIQHFMYSHGMFDELLRTKKMRMFCTKEASTDILKLPAKFKNKYKWPKLEELAKHYGIEMDEENLHDAMYDVALLQSCFEALIVDPEFEAMCIAKEAEQAVLQAREKMLFEKLKSIPAPTTFAQKRKPTWKQHQQEEEDTSVTKKANVEEEVFTEESAPQQV